MRRKALNINVFRDKPACMNDALPLVIGAMNDYSEYYTSQQQIQTRSKIPLRNGLKDL